MYKWYEDSSDFASGNSGDPIGIVIVAGLIALVSFNMRDAYPKDDIKRWGWNLALLISSLVAISAFLKL
jgi:hypothetical protein